MDHEKFYEKKIDDWNDVGYIHGFREEEMVRLEEQGILFKEAFVTEFLTFPKDASFNILEIGCGVGAQTQNLLENYPNIKLTSIDACGPYLDRAQRKLQQYIDGGRLKLLFSDARNLPFEDNTFDHVFTSFIFEHITDPKKAISEAYRVLKPEGQLYASEVFDILNWTYPINKKFIKYWGALSDHQRSIKGEPSCGAFMREWLVDKGFKIELFTPKHFVGDSTCPSYRKDLANWTKKAMLSCTHKLIESGRIDSEMVTDIVSHLDKIGEESESNNSIMYYGWISVIARK